ncbi:MAG TPA: hypothetical protein VG848_04155 [Acetobacteraceae bacterium]|nr:hypothetical protein [Acetobacteraceae bacterium]
MAESSQMIADRSESGESRSENPLLQQARKPEGGFFSEQKKQKDFASFSGPDAGYGR